MLMLCRCWGGWNVSVAHSNGRRSEEACEMLCDGGSGPEFCGGVGANAVYTLPAPVAPEDVPEYEYLGRCMLLSSS
jgi:hypothetical protein